MPNQIKAHAALSMDERESRLVNRRKSRNFIRDFRKGSVLLPKSPERPKKDIFS